MSEVYTSLLLSSILLGLLMGSATKLELSSETELSTKETSSLMEASILKTSTQLDTYKVEFNRLNLTNIAHYTANLKLDALLFEQGGKLTAGLP